MVVLQKHKRRMSSPRHGGELQAIKQPQKVKVLILSESRASFKDFYLIATFTRLIKIDLSYNKITAFPPGFSFRTFTQLRTLFLHYNKFAAIKHLLPVTESSSLHYLTLFGNPLEEAKARHFFVNELPTLLLMDDKPVRLDERNPDFSLGDRPIPLLTFPLTPPLAEEPQSKIYIQVLIRELTIARRAYLQANPVVRVQRWWRHCLRKTQRKWKNTNTKPPQEAVALPQQSSLKEYKHSLEEMQAEEEAVRKPKPKPEEMVFAVLNGNYSFWKFMDGMAASGRVFLSRQFCMLRGIHFQQTDLLVIKRPQSIAVGKRRLPLLVWWHQQMIIRNHKKTTKKPMARDISLKSCEEYKINRNRFMHYQQRLIKREEDYRHFVSPQLTPIELTAIIRKEYWRAMRNLLSGRNYQFPFLMEGLAARQRAAVSIQRVWRGCKVRKSVNAYLKIKEKESAIRIQRWIRRLPFIHRRKFLLEVAHYLKGQRNSQITLEVGQLEAIEAYTIYKEKYSCNFSIPFQTSSFSVSPVPPHNILFHAPRKPYPAYMGLSFGAEKRQGSAFVRSSVLQILFKGVRQVNRVTDSRGMRFVQLGFDSIQEALNRKFILALKTYRMVKHQFIRSREAPNVPSQYSLDVIAEINQNRMVSIAYDALERHQGTVDSALRKLQVSRSQGSQLALVNNTLSLHLKYFIAKTDLSCTLSIREMAYRREERHPMQLQMKQFYLPRRVSHRYDEDYAPDISSKISRNILSLEELQPTQTQRRETGPYTKILSTDQSHTVLDGGEDLGRSVNRLMSYRKSESYDRFDKQVYPPPVLSRNSQPWPSQDATEKRERIQEIKAVHKKNIASISLQKTENLTQLRQSVRRESEDRLRMIDDARSIQEQERVRQHDRVRDHFKSATSNFEHEFMKKGIGNIRRGLRDFQKKRPHGQLPASPPQNHSLKTEIKELSLTFDPEQPSRQVLKQSVLTYDLKEPTLKSQPSEPVKEEEEAEVSAETGHAVLKKVKQDAQRKKLRKKRLVHSVFPQEFYPIKQSNQIGFELPRIIKK